MINQLLPESCIIYFLISHITTTIIFCPKQGSQEAVPQKENFDLKLVAFDAKAKIKIIKEVRSITGLGLKEAKELVEGTPKVVVLLFFLLFVLVVVFFCRLFSDLNFFNVLNTVVALCFALCLHYTCRY